jgi:5-methylcytosine-specific restriction endonuclease McrA
MPTTRPGILFECPVCRAPIRSNNGTKSRRTCSWACTRELQRRNKVNFRGDQASPQALRGRARTRLRDQITACEACGHDGSRSRLEVHHRDGVPSNNAMENLQVLCILCHKAQHSGPRRYTRSAKLTTAQILEIRARWERREATQIALGKEYGVNRGTIGNIVNGHRFRLL